MFRLFKSKRQLEEERAESERRLQESINEEKERRRAEREIKMRIKENYEMARRDYGYLKGHNGIVTYKNKKWYAFTSDGHFKLFICQPTNWDLESIKNQNWQKQSISINNIHYFSREGEKYTETKITGGGTKPLNIADVAIAGALAGSTGAIIASRPQNEAIRSKTIRHDERKTILFYNKGKLEFAPEDYDVLMRLIPDKEFSVVQQKRAIQKAGQAEMQAEKKDDVVNSLRKLKMMLEEDLISQDEYDSKKKEILGRM